MLRIVKSGDWGHRSLIPGEIRSAVLKELDQQKHDHSELVSETMLPDYCVNRRPTRELEALEFLDR